MAIPGLNFARNLIQCRTLIAQLVRRDFEQRFVGSAAGWLWGVIHPIVLLVSWIFVFEVCLHQKLPAGEVTHSYGVFLFCGFLPWLLFQETVTRSSTSLVDHATLITKTVFPSEILPVTIFLSSLISHFMALGLVFAVVGIWMGELSPLAVFLPIYTLLLGMFAVGIGWIVASLQVYIRDTAQLLTVAMTLWFWITPIFLSEKQIPVKFVLRMNPLAYVVRAYRDRLLSPRVPDLTELAVLSAFAITTFVVGGLFFRHLKRGFADVL